MILRIVFFALMAVGLIGFGTVAWIATRPTSQAQAATAAPKIVTALTAKHAIGAGALLKPEDVEVKQVSSKDLPSDAAPTSEDERHTLTGSMVRRALGAGDIIRTTDVISPSDHGFLAAVLAPGMRAVTVAVDAVAGSAGLIEPGDRVDLILTQTMAGRDEPIGHRVAAETVLSDARVIAINQQIVQGAEAANTGNGRTRTVTLEVTQDQAERVSVANNLGKLSLSVRSAGAGQDDQNKTGITWAQDVSPALANMQRPQRPASNSIKVFQGSAEAVEFKF
jgi:pilus assembly protein CpaB